MLHIIIITGILLAVTKLSIDATVLGGVAAYFYLRYKSVIA
jgi:hypothetical protein